MAKTSRSTPKLIATIDVALFTLHDGELCVAVAARDREPKKDELALIGGYVHTDEDEDTLATAKRVLRQKAGVAVPYLEQLYTFSGSKRDDRGWSISVAYIAVVPEATLSTSTGVFSLVPVNNVPKLPFDHNAIVAQAAMRLRNKSTYSSLPAFLLPEHFTLNELQSVYEQTLGMKFDRPNFRSRIKAQEIVEAVEGQRASSITRPAQLYRLVVENLTEFKRQFVSSP